MTGRGAESWKLILSRLNAILLNSNEWNGLISQEARSSGWCGAQPAEEIDILGAEQRLGITLPSSYRAFLTVSNGWHPFSSFIERLLPVQEIGPFQTADPQRLALLLNWHQVDDVPDSVYLDYETPENSEVLRLRYYPDCILVGKPYGVESDMLLLNPQVIFPDGEWETIFFANWIPGNQRFRSFRAFVEHSIDSEEKFAKS